MTDHPHNPDDPIFHPFDPETGEDHDGDDESVEAIFIRPRQRSTADHPADPYDLGWLFLCWAWEAGYRDWTRALRVLARVLRGLEQTGLVERRTIRRDGRPTHHGFVLTAEGREAVMALSGDWITGVNR